MRLTVSTAGPRAVFRGGPNFRAIPPASAMAFSQPDFTAEAVYGWCFRGIYGQSEWNKDGPGAPTGRGRESFR